MNSSKEDPPLSSFPPIICNNPRKKIEPEEVDLNDLATEHRTHKEKSIRVPELVYSPAPELKLPCPRYPLTLIWSPDRLYFELDEEPIIRKLWIWNGSDRPIYIHCCGLWNDSARLGAGWRTYPRTRLRMAPGLKHELCIKATPRRSSPVPCAAAALQLAAAHMRDLVTGFFIVPICAKFLKHTEPSIGEE